MWWEPSQPPSALVVRKIDDLDARLHMEWHRLCTCQWDHVHTDEQVLPVQVTRHPTADCPVHP
jgi:hypothetical protein